GPRNGTLSREEKGGQGRHSFPSDPAVSLTIAARKTGIHGKVALRSPDGSPSRTSGRKSRRRPNPLLPPRPGCVPINWYNYIDNDGDAIGAAVCVHSLQPGTTSGRSYPWVATWWWPWGRPRSTVPHSSARTAAAGPAPPSPFAGSLGVRSPPAKPFA